ncbi:MAG TPA: hypothetical protein VK914_00635 [bacterium]|jgi:hypothetical protein|nr:hypothetical protein [bacterium]
MRVTVRYSGTLSDPSSLVKLREDFQDIAATQGWPVDLMDRENVFRSRMGGGRTMAPPLALAGLKVVVHPQTDPLWLTFDEAGVLTRLGSFPIGQAPALGEERSPRLGFLHQSQASMQTSIGGSELHLTVVGLLDYLKRAYVHDLKVTDDSGFWDDRDAEALRRLMDGR